MVLYIRGGAGFLPSTVVGLEKKNLMDIIKPQKDPWDEQYIYLLTDPIKKLDPFM